MPAVRAMLVVTDEEVPGAARKHLFIPCETATSDFDLPLLCPARLGG
jgi:hypothetical protein